MTSFKKDCSSDYVFKKTISKNTFEQVDLYEIKGGVYAIKKTNLSRVFDEKIKNEILEEKKKDFLRLEKGLDNVVKAYEFHHDKHQEIIEISYDFYEQNLKEYIDSKGPLNLKLFLPLFKDIITGTNG